MNSWSPESREPARSADDPLAGRDWPTLVFIAFSVAVSLQYPQTTSDEQTFLQYLTYIVPAVAIPLARPLHLLAAFGGRAAWLLALYVPAASWQLIHGDYAALNQITLLVLVYTWYVTSPVRILRQDLYLIFLLALGAGVFIELFTTLNEWGLVPGTSTYPGSGMRVSFFPNIAFTGFLSLAAFMVLTMDDWKPLLRRPIAWVVTYFLVFSFVRTVTASVIIYVPLMALLHARRRSPMLLFWAPLLTAVVTNLFIAYSPLIFQALQSVPVISTLFLRGEVGLNDYEIYQQFFRPWLWEQHWAQFTSSPWLMGLGYFDFNANVAQDLVVGHEYTDSVSLPTRMLAQFGLPTLFFVGFLLACLWNRAKAADYWACAAFPIVVLGLLQWGTMFHPTSGFGALLFLMMVKGRAAFPSAGRQSLLSPAAAHAHA